MATSLVESAQRMKLKPSEMSPDVRAMIDLRHAAEQRGHFQPLGRLLTIETQHGMILFPAKDGDSAGPDVALWSSTGGVELKNVLILLGPWADLPSLRKNSDISCPKCRHACDICDGSGKKQCEQFGCGGRGWTPGPLELCNAEGCREQTGHFNPACAVCGGSGQVNPKVKCAMCSGTGKMTCSRCKGTGKFSTGYKGGALPEGQFKVPPNCPTCSGAAFQGEWAAQEAEKFANAVMRTHERVKNCAKMPRDFLALGPIFNFNLQEFSTGRIRTYEVSADTKGDLLFLLVPAGKVKHPKAYLVGGVVREKVLSEKRA